MRIPALRAFADSDENGFIYNLNASGNRRAAPMLAKLPTRTGPSD